MSNTRKSNTRKLSSNSFASKNTISITKHNWTLYSASNKNQKKKLQGEKIHNEIKNPGRALPPSEFSFVMPLTRSIPPVPVVFVEEKITQVKEASDGHKKLESSQSQDVTLSTREIYMEAALALVDQTRPRITLVGSRPITDWLTGEMSTDHGQDCKITIEQIKTLYRMALENRHYFVADLIYGAHSNEHAIQLNAIRNEVNNQISMRATEEDRRFYRGLA